MAHVVLFHSVRGLERLEREATDRLAAAGHVVVAPDLFDGATAERIEDGMTLLKDIGWNTVRARAEAAAAPLPPETVLGGFSFGAEIAATLLGQRPVAGGLLLLHGLAQLPDTARPGLPVQLHLAQPDPWEEEDFVPAVEADAARLGLALETFRYPGAGHLFTDPTLPDHDAHAAATLWRRVDDFLARL